MLIEDFRIRASYPNYYMVNLFADKGEEIFNHDSGDPDNLLEGNKPGTVIYQTTDGERHEYPPRWYDMFHLLKEQQENKRSFLEKMILSDKGDADAIAELVAIRKHDRQKCKEYVDSHKLKENKYLITNLVKGDFNDEAISHKGRMLLDLTRNCYPVPDFCILTAASFVEQGMLAGLLDDAIYDLEVMTGCRLGDPDSPLVFAIRCAMPQYIPGLMPTLLNIGVTRVAYEGLRRNHPDGMANRVYLSTLHSIYEMLNISGHYDTSDVMLSIKGQFDRIEEMEKKIIATRDDGQRLLSDAHYQSLKLIEYVRDFYLDHQDLILTFMQGKQAFPSLILQRMVWTIGNNESYPGVLYSRHSRTGKGRQIESYRNIFGEEIMTGDVSSQDTAYSDRSEIIETFPAVYHFDPLLKKLESRYSTPVTIEFAVETRPQKVSLFSVLQLNMSEMTGRAALLSAIDMYEDGQINATGVMGLIKPYHLRQIVSAAIDDHSLAKLKKFGEGINVLPRTAISATLCFSTTRARKEKSRGNNVCLCQERFIPEDTITLNEVDAILSLAPAAIHVVTACRGYGIPAFMDLQNYGIRISTDGDRKYLQNSDGLTVEEGDTITMSSKRQTIYKGIADFKPARFTKYMEGEEVELNEEEVVYFKQMKHAYLIYQDIVTSEKASYINDVETLARLIRCNLQNKPDTARQIVNSWYDSHSQQYINQVLQSRMGDHQDQSRVFDLLSEDRKSAFFEQATRRCITNHQSGLGAGAFMLGRFISKPLPVTLWKELNDEVVAFLLNEYVLYEKYLHVLEEVGEIRLARAHSRIETEGIDNMVIKNFDLYTFVPLLASTRDWNAIAKSLEDIDHQDNTHLLIEKLSQPFDKIFDLSKPWVANRIESLKKTE